ncbi:protocadherin-11 X-linked-like [Mercenaria mercenaria]|uniref:protocadherin-11 X-linked-like n=1 Tax=Mercenaria mercenaria TaxID=6596 RepID=UPI00234F3298|nr:protocadherin-11 X-linked-like [Mercenaria mercenaria]XP_045205575.2 protocadherin-11 X-linked-like [Mercenaria mercenaria]XP_045205578.2 protocadherin-11 X-linked-like [Mercenaria mercenaria]XP_053400233.1 protocadherin-11 X-linked-like [Mercenaria mercenaria]
MASDNFRKLGFILVLTLSAVNLTTGQDYKITFTKDEELEKWTFVGNVSDAPGFLRSIPAADRGSLLFHFLEQTMINSILSIHDETGSLFTTVVIDRESIPECRVPDPCVLSFDIAATSERKDSSLFEIISVNFVINDINDNSPTFPRDTQAIAISEAAVNGSSYLIESANDNDTGANNSIQYYELIGDLNVFALDVERKLDGSLSVKLLIIGKLDRERKDSYTCTVIAKDGGRPQRSGTMELNITITDENDNAPYFTKTAYNITVKEDTEDGTGILQISATDNDIKENSWLLYRLSPHQSDLEELKSLFYINEHTGVLSVIGQLVYEPGKIYKIIVEAVDRGKPSLLSTNQAVVTVYVEDTGNNPPTVKINLLSSGTGRVVNVSEFSTVDTFVAHVEVKDKDTGQNGDVSCSVDDSFFALKALSNKGFKVVVAKTLDSEKQDLHTVVVTCKDKGNPVLSSSDNFLVRVTDENDSTPKFTKRKYYEDFFENNDRGDLVISVRATDADKSNTNNSKIEYYLEPAVRDYFAIDASTGTIRALAPFDREDKSVWTFKVFARDFGKPPLTGNATVNIRIKDQNDNAPKFSNATFHFYVQENLPSGTVVDRLTAKDYDVEENGMFTYAISDTKETKLPFLLFPDGVIKTTMELDREKKESYEFTVIAIDKGVPKRTSSANVVVKVTDVNDESPKIVFPKKDINDTIVIDHLKPSGSFITKIEAYDLDEGDNSKLSYVIEEGNANRLFLLNLKSGVLSVAQPYEVEENAEEKFTLVIAVHDGGIPQRSERGELNVVIKYSNETTTEPPPVSSGPNTNIVIVIVVIFLTFFLSLAIIIVICVIRKFDRDRMKTQNIQINKLPNNMTEIRDNTANGTIMSRPYDKVDSLKKKKEVSFSFEDDLDGLGDHELSFSNNSVFTEPVTEVPHHERQTSHQMKTFQLQQALLNSQTKPWTQTNGQKPTEGTPNEKDTNSDTSRETVTSDSGRGGSDDDLPLSHNNSKDERESHLSSSGGGSQFLKCSLPKKHSHSNYVPPNAGTGNYSLTNVQNCSLPPHRNSRPQSTDLTERIPNNKIPMERSLSNLVEGEKPKFTVRKPYIDREKIDKKSESWVPSYV